MGFIDAEAVKKRARGRRDRAASRAGERLSSVLPERKKVESRASRRNEEVKRRNSDSSKPQASSGKKYNVGVSKGGVSFKDAFKHFSNKGNKTFTWNGKKYTTEQAKTAKASKPAKAAKPAARSASSRGRTAAKTPKQKMIDRRRRHTASRTRGR